ncbi:MAG: Uncharacterised protein [Prochlorococcus marinus str. MIT 9313]|nr:MAG: Uncharacterised protein [Prochlorococcus marinus str. MIT 9313]
MGIGFVLQQSTSFLKCRNDGGVGVFEHVETSEWTRLACHCSAFVYWAEHAQVVLLACVEVVDTMAWGRVHKTSSRFGGDVLTADHDRTVSIQ